MQKKELHLGKNLTQLEQYFAIDAKMIRKKPVHQWVGSIKITESLANWLMLFQDSNELEENGREGRDV